jgi:hypothetical protein
VFCNGRPFEIRLDSSLPDNQSIVSSRIMSSSPESSVLLPEHLSKKSEAGLSRRRPGSQSCAPSVSHRSLQLSQLSNSRNNTRRNNEPTRQSEFLTKSSECGVR